MSELELFENKNGLDMSSDAVKAYMYLFTGQISSKYKMFNETIIVKMNDLVRLDNTINEKLRLNKVYQNMVNSSVDVRLENNATVSFGTFNEFSKYHFNESSPIESMLLKWDFFLHIDSYQNPQRHTITVRINSGIKTLDVLQAIFNGSPNDIEKTEMEMSQVYCRVDFINSLLSDEIVNIVQSWVKSCEPGCDLNCIMDFFKRNIELCKTFSKYLTYSAFFIGSLAILKKYSSIDIKVFLMIFIIMQHTIVKDISNYFSKKVYLSLLNYGEYCKFEITNGDINKKSQFQKKKKKYISVFIFNIVVPFLLNILSSYALNYIK